MSLSVAYDRPINRSHPSALGVLASVDFLSEYARAGTRLRESVQGVDLVRSGAALASGDWIKATDEHWFKQDGGSGTIYSTDRLRPITRYPFSVVARVYAAATTSSPLIALLVSGDTTYIIALDVSTTWRWILRNGGGTINADEYLALAGPSPTLNEAYTTIFSAWGNTSDACKSWFQRDGQSATSHTAGSTFTMGFPAAYDTLAIGGTDTSTTMTGRVAAARLCNYGMTDALAVKILDDPVGWLRGPYVEPEWKMHRGVPLANVARGSAGVGQSVLVR